MQSAPSACVRQKSTKGGSIMAKFDPEIHDDNPPMDTVFMVGMKPSRRGRPKSETPKVEVKIRLDAKTVEHLRDRSEEHTSELQSLMRTSYAVFCLKTKNQYNTAH